MNKRNESFKLSADVFQKDIPETAPDIYVSGRHALNVPGDTSGDWHFTTVWLADAPEKINLWGRGQFIDTTPIFGDFGIADRKAALEKTGLKAGAEKVYIADHYRAILDLMIAGAMNNSMGIVIGATMDYLDTEEQKAYLLAHAEKALLSDSLSAEQKDIIRTWIARERRDIYRGGT